MIIGDTTYFTIQTSDGSEKEENILNYIISEPSKESAWQIYLLSRSENVMPTFWHGGYRYRYFIFNENDINEIKPLQIYDPTPLSENNLLLPQVSLLEKSDTADVYCTYWNDWKGLVREHVKIYFHEDKTISLKECEELVLFPYNCGICF